MAIRSTSGTGVLVALVVFIILSVGLLTTTIIFYSKSNKEADEATKAAKTLDAVATEAERSGTDYTTVEGNSGRESVFGYLHGQHKALQDYVGSAAEIDDLREAYSADFGVRPTDSLRIHLQNNRRQLRENENTITTLSERVKNLTDENDSLRDSLAMARTERDRTLEASPERVIEPIRSADSEYQQQVAQAIDMLEQAKDRNRKQFVGQIQDMEREVDRLEIDNIQAQSRIEELNKLIDRSRIQSPDPASLVDGEVIEVTGRGDQVYINRGQDDQIVLGMTFEVYDDAAQIRTDENGNVPRGKASIQVVKVGETTATAKVTRGTKGRPVVSKDVIANAIYDPNYRFKFLIHGKFDIDGDGRPSDEETRYLQRQVEAWGGELVADGAITGDLDFLVLGVEPPNPLPPESGDSDLRIQQILDQRLVYQQYQDLFNAAKKADIPVLNANRLRILTGQTGL